MMYPFEVEFKEFVVEKDSRVYGTETWEHYIFVFPNKYGASVIRKPGSYGYEDYLWEVAVIEQVDDGLVDLCYDTPITDDVVGWCDDSEVYHLLKQISELEVRNG